MVEDRSTARDVGVQHGAHLDRGRLASRNLDVDRLTTKVSGVIVSYEAEEGDYLIDYLTTVYRYVAHPANQHVKVCASRFKISISPTLDFDLVSSSRVVVKSGTVMPPTPECVMLLMLLSVRSASIPVP